MSSKAPGTRQQDRVLTAIAKEASTVAEIRERCGLASGAAARACSELRAQGLIMRTDAHQSSKRPARWALTRNAALTMKGHTR